MQLINDALKRVQTERQDELKARREARQAQQAKHAAQQAERAAKHAAKPVTKSQQLEASRAAAQPLEGKISQQQQQQGAEQRHQQEPPAANGKAEPHALRTEQAAEEGKASQKASAVLQDAAALKRQEKILSAGNIPDNVRLELSAQNVAPSAADGAPGKPAAAAEEPKGSTAGKAGKAGAPKRKRLQLDDSTDDEELAAVRGVKAAVLPGSAAKGKQTTPAKAAKRANDANPGEAARGHAFVRRDSEPNEGNEDDAEREARKMREAAEKVTCPATPLVMTSQMSSKFNMPAFRLCTRPGRERGSIALICSYRSYSGTRGRNCRPGLFKSFEYHRHGLPVRAWDMSKRFYKGADNAYQEALCVMSRRHPSLHSLNPCRLSKG